MWTESTYDFNGRERAASRSFERASDSFSPMPVMLGLELQGPHVPALVSRLLQGAELEPVLRPCRLSDPGV